MDCFFNCFESIIRIISNKVILNISFIEVLNKWVMINIINRIDIVIWNIIVEISGLWLIWLLFYKVINLIEWFFFIIMVCKKGDMYKIVKIVFVNGF